MGDVCVTRWCFCPPQHKYVSIAEVQMKREEELQQCPLTLVSRDSLPLYGTLVSEIRALTRLVACLREQGEEEVEDTPAETLYLGMLPNLSQFVVSDSGKTLLRFFLF